MGLINMKHLIEIVLYNVEDGADCQELLDLIEDADTFRWRKLTEEMPKMNVRLMFKALGEYYTGYFKGDTEFINDDYEGFVTPGIFQTSEVIAWKYIEPYEEGNDGIS